MRIEGSSVLCFASESVALSSENFGITEAAPEGKAEAVYLPVHLRIPNASFTFCVNGLVSGLEGRGYRSGG
ncbi:hypothetical protein E2C01_011035 [Portunus trituberculatus]|uniref:Uncharacterized protein n=1 Tax=Portunus trituberculatus TaxID=210409 RepID=A0A5B7DAD0_PORTR|nr:hypothetical protein [Portunus trituberculatus]